MLRRVTKPLCTVQASETTCVATPERRNFRATTILKALRAIAQCRAIVLSRNLLRGRMLMGDNLL